MIIVVPQFRQPDANYFFIADEHGNIVRVCYPDGDRALRIGEQD